MSHIFDALHKSVADQSGMDLPLSVPASDLLATTERKIATERMPGIGSSPLQAPVTTASAKTGTNLSSVDQFTQFERLKVLVSPQERIVSLTEEESLAAEKFRFLGVRLRQLKQNRPLKKLLITSTMPGEGKSVVAANIACTMAKRAQKTLLLDGDLRRPVLAKMFGLGKVVGLSEWLEGECGPADSIYHLESAGLWLLPAGTLSKHPMELMQSGKLSAVMDQLTQLFDWIIIDCPPVLPLADTSIWMRLADGILLVTRQGKTEKEQLQRGIEAIEPKKLLGALLNGSSHVRDTDYYHSYGASGALQQSRSSSRM